MVILTTQTNAFCAYNFYPQDIKPKECRKMQGINFGLQMRYVAMASAECGLYV